MTAYLKLLAFLLVLTLVMAIKDVGILVLFVTLGLGFPLVFSATLLAYALCAGPFVALWSESWREWLVGAGLSLAALAVVGLLPGWLGSRQAGHAAKVYTAGDHAPERPVEGASLEIRRPANNYPDYFVDSQPCGGECRAVLSEGRVKWIRVVVEQGTRSAPARMRYRLAAKPDCTPSQGRPVDAGCIEIVDDTDERADIEVVFAPGQRFRDKPGSFALVEFDSTTAVLAQVRREGKPVEVFRQTEVDAQVAMTPTVLGPGGSGMTTSGVQLMRRQVRINQLSLSRVLSALGLLGSGSQVQPVIAIPHRDWKAGVDDAMTAQLESILRLSQVEPFNTEQARVVSDWVMHARRITTWSPEQVALLRRIARDRRLKVPTSFDQIFERQPEITRALLPDVLDLIEANGITREYTPERQAAYTLSRIDPALVEPYSARILDLVQMGEDRKAILLPAVGRLGVDPLPHLLPFEADLDKKRSPYAAGFPRAQGACRADARWAPALIVELRKTVTAVRDGNNRPQAFEVALLKALYNLGDREFVLDQLASRPKDMVDRVTRDIDRAISKRNPSAALCSF